MKKISMLLITMSFISIIEAKRHLSPSRSCQYEGQLCTRWDGKIGWCRTRYDIKGFPTIFCEAIPEDHFGYPDHGYFFPGPVLIYNMFWTCSRIFSSSTFPSIARSDISARAALEQIVLNSRNSS